MCEPEQTSLVPIWSPSRNQWELAGVDRCIAPLVAALNGGGVPTVASCCGHGRSLGVVSLVDGRDLVISRSQATTAALNANASEWDKGQRGMPQPRGERR